MRSFVFALCFAAGAALNAGAGDLRLAASGTPERRAADRDVSIWLSGRTLAAATAEAAPKPQPPPPPSPAADVDHEADEVDALTVSIMPYPDLAAEAASLLRTRSADSSITSTPPADSSVPVEKTMRWQTIIATGRDERERSMLALLTIFAARMEERDGIPAAATIAMALHESNYGRSQLSAQHNNYFGLKVGRAAEPFVSLPTKELGRMVRANFRAYQDFEAGIAGFSEFLRRYPRYQVAWHYRDARSFVAALLKAGYCPEPDYMSCIEVIFKRHKLDTL